MRKQSDSFITFKYRDPTVIGSSVQHLSLNPVCPVLIIKDRQLRSQKPDQKYRWAVCIDGSSKSMKALDFVAKLMDKSKDELVVITVETIRVDGNHIKK